MKKFATLSLALIMTVLLSISAFAAPGIFVASPSGNPAPTLVDYDLDCDCDVKLILTAYIDRATLSEENLAAIEKAYLEIAKREDSKSLKNVLNNLAKDKNLKPEDLAVSDLFDISLIGDGHVAGCPEGYTITLKADTLNALVGVIRMNADGEWEEVKIVSYDEENGTVTIYTKELSPFAFVVNTYETPDTGDNSMAYLWGIIAAVSGLICVFIAPKALAKKKKA